MRVTDSSFFLSMLNDLRTQGHSYWKASERLSSALKINGAADDPSGLAISKQMSAMISGNKTAYQNLQDGLSMVRMMDGALDGIQNILMRVRDLAVRACNQAILRPDCQDRTRLNKEARLLINQIDVQARSVRFTDKKILSGDYLKSITKVAGSEQIVSNGSPAFSPGWGGNDKVTYTAQVTSTGLQTGTRPGGAETTNRVFIQTINPTTNATMGAETQLTSDPGRIYDGDNDTYFNFAGINDPNDGNNLYPLNDPDVDSDGYRATVDDDDSDPTETGSNAGVNFTLAGDYTLVAGAPVETQNLGFLDAAWNNTRTWAFTAGVVDQVQVKEMSGAKYQVQVYDIDTSTWTDVGAAGTGDGTWQTVDFGGEYNANSIRVVLDDPVAQNTGVVSIQNLKNKDVVINGPLAASPPDTYRFDFGGGAVPLNSFKIDVTPGVGFTMYENVAGVAVAKATGVGTVAQTGINFSPALLSTTDCWVELNAPGTVTMFQAEQKITLTAGGMTTDGINDYYRYNVSGGPLDVTDIDVTTSGGGAYDVHLSAPPSGVDFSGTSGTNLSFGGAQNISSLWISVPTGETVTSIAASNTPATINGPVLEPHEFILNLNTPGQEINWLDLQVTGGVSYQLYTDTGFLLTNSGSYTGPVALIDPNYLRVEFAVGGGTAADIISATGEYRAATGGAGASSFVDLNGDDLNVATYTLNTSAGNVSTKFDQYSIGIKNNHPYTLQYSDDGIAWATLESGVGTGAAVTTNLTNEITVDVNDDGTAYMRVIMHSGEKTSDAVISAPTLVNRIDRDGDLFPDAIEINNGSNPNSAASLPFGATGGPDDDGDGHLDYPALYDTMDNAPGPLASSNPGGYQWQNGSGNPLNSPMPISGTPAQYPNVGDRVDVSQVPSFTDTDGDTLPDPFDPFVGTAEFATWLDGDSTYSAGKTMFVSNRGNPNDSDQSQTMLYRLVAGTYSQVAGTNGATNPIYSYDGSAYAWEMGGGIYINYDSLDCGGTTNNPAVQVTADGANPTWSPVGNQVAFDRGGKVLVADLNGSTYDYEIYGENPTWSPDGDMLAYVRGGNMYVYDFVSEAEFDLETAGEDPIWSPMGDKLAFQDGTDIKVISLQIDRTPALTQIGCDNGASFRMDLPFPDARAYSLGVSSINLLTQAAAESAIDYANNAINMVSQARAEVGIVEKRMRHIAEELMISDINMMSSKALYEDADMAVEAAQLVRGQILVNSSESVMAQATDALRTSSVDILRMHLGKATTPQEMLRAQLSAYSIFR